MATKVRAELSPNNKYWISKHRYYELKYFCLQYPTWRKAYLALDDISITTNNLKMVITRTNEFSDPTSKCIMAKARYEEKISMVEKAALEADNDLYNYILKAVTEDLSFTYLKTKLDMPCSRDTYYDRYRRFFWLLSKARN